MNQRVTAADAMAAATEAKTGLESHEAVCAERYARIFETLADLKTLAKWAAGSLCGTLVALIAWMGVQLYSGQSARLDALEHTTEAHP